MAKTTKPAETSDNRSSYENYFDLFFELSNQFSESYKKQIGEDNPEELEVLSAFCGTLVNATENVRKEMMIVYRELDEDATSMVNRHIENSGLLAMQRSAVDILKAGKKKSKLELIIEIIKKIILQLIELIKKCFNIPPWLDKVFCIIILLLELIDNVWPKILELLGIKSAFLKEAEREMLEFRPKWTNLRASMSL